MRAIAVANIKGGSGKTTIATNLAAWLAGRGRRVVIADVDRQRSALGWVERRPAHLPQVEGRDLSRDWERVDDADVVVYDVPASMRRKDLEEVVKAVDVVVIPVLPSAFDEDGTRRFLDLVAESKPVRKGRLPLVAVANRVRERTHASRRLQEFLASLDVRVAGAVRDAAAYAHLAASGRSLFDETDVRSRALLEDWDPLLAALSEL
jgi:chromosome partitioning protein